MKKRLWFYVLIIAAIGIFNMRIQNAAASTINLTDFQKDSSGATGEIFTTLPGTPYVFCITRNNDMVVPGNYNYIPKSIATYSPPQPYTFTTEQLQEAAWIMHTYDPNGVDVQTGAKVQESIWISLGEYHTTDYYYNDASTLVTAAMSHSADWATIASNYTIFQLNGQNGCRTTQDLIGAVPEPLTVFLLGFGLLGFGVFELRKRRGRIAG